MVSSSTSYEKSCFPADKLAFTWPEGVSQLIKAVFSGSSDPITLVTFSWQLISAPLFCLPAMDREQIMINYKLGY